MNLKQKIILFAIIAFLLSVVNNQLLGQKFGGAMLFGLNAAQIDGDLLAGYNKLGLTGGVKLSYGLEEPWFLSMELLYSQRGSQSELVADSNIPIKKINLQYIELPLSVIYKDWWIDDDAYYKVEGEMGLSYAYLFNASISEGSFTVGTEDFQINDLGFLLGARYLINKHWGFGARYSRSVTKLYKNPDTRERDLLGYFLSFRTFYQF